jgi:hypothetical protein
MGAIARATWIQTTLDIVFNVTHYLELRYAITIYCISHFFPNEDQISCLDIIEHSHLYLVRKLHL